MPKDFPIGTKAISPFVQALKDRLGETNQFRAGAVAEVILLKKDRRAAYFDIGSFATGVVYGVELQNARSILKEMNPGDKIAARIESIDGFEGYAELSLSAAGRQKAWQEVKVFEESGELIKAKVTGANQGGVLVDVLGLRGFVPASQLSNEHAPKDIDGDRRKIAEELQKLVGLELEVKVITVLPRNNKLICSERETIAPSANISGLLDQYAVGQVVSGIVSGIADFGIFVKFVDKPEIEGLVHISEIDHRIIDSPKEVVQLGETAQVKIIDIKDGRVYLSLKALKADPWGTAGELYKEGQEVSGKIYKFNPFGAVVDLSRGLQGLIHVSEYGGSDEMKAALKLGETYPFLVASVKPDEKRIVLKKK